MFLSRSHDDRAKGSTGIQLDDSVGDRIHHLVTLGKRPENFTACQNERASFKIRNDIP
jgi:hypothetical protein